MQERRTHLLKWKTAVAIEVAITLLLIRIYVRVGIVNPCKMSKGLCLFVVQLFNNQKQNRRRFFKI